MANDKIIWDRLIQAIPNPYGVAGLMGNLQAESALIPTNLQNSFEKSLGMNDATYTEKVDNGSYTNFAKDSAGYGLAQWTSSGRKQNLLNFAKQKNKSIGDLEMQIDFLIQELKTSYSLVFKTLNSATSIREASDIVLTKFEMPYNQSESVKTLRANFGKQYFDKYAKVTYYPQYEDTLNKALASLSIDNSYDFRKKIATANGIVNYTGTKEQNIKLFDLLKAGKLIKP